MSTNATNNILWQDLGVSPEERARKNGHRGACLWLTGLPSSGKSTIAIQLQKDLFSKGWQAYILDGDNIRHGLSKDLGFSHEDRRENIRRIAEVARLFVDAGFIVITAFISPYRDDRAIARALFPKGTFFEVFVKADLATCEARDVKGLYKKARLGLVKDFTGVSAPYEEPLAAELTIDTTSTTPAECCGKIFQKLTQDLK
jgi:adenylylsulfate kinase